MKILFYLPITTPWWFTTLLTPMLRAFHGEAKVHVIIAARWRNTGIDAEQLAPLADLDRICWHVVDDEHREAFRRDGAAVPGLLDLVRAIDADLTLVRSADTRTPALFPGTVRYLMEGACPPFSILPLDMLVEERPFALGEIPPHAEAVAERCVAELDDVWTASRRQRHPVLRADWRTVLGLPRDRPILAVPLHYEHEENFFLMHSRFPKAVDLISHLDRVLDPDIFLAVTDHPLNRRHVDRTAVEEHIFRHSERAAFCQLDEVPGGASGVLAAHADAVLIEQSKSWMLAAHAGTPMVRIGTSVLAPWLNATELDDPRLANWTKGALPAPDVQAAQRYFCWHLGARAFVPGSVSLARLLEHVSGAVGDPIIHANADILRGHLKAAA